MVATWIEEPARGRLGGPVRSGMWSNVVVGTHPIELGQKVYLEVQIHTSDSDQPLSIGPLPGYWLNNLGVNSLWHVPIPPQSVRARLRYRSVARSANNEVTYSPYQEAVVRPNLPDETDAMGLVEPMPEGLVGNRHMTVKVDARGTTYDVFFPTVGLRSDIRPAEGDLPQSRSNFRVIMGGLAVGRRVDWFCERLCWAATQAYQKDTNLLQTELNWRQGPIRVVATDLVVNDQDYPRRQEHVEAPGQYLKRFQIFNEFPEKRRALFGVFVQAEVNGGIGEPGLIWRDEEQSLVAMNHGHGHSNRKLARSASVEFAIALVDRRDVYCEPTGPNEAMIFSWVDLPPGQPVSVDVIVSGAFSDHQGDRTLFAKSLKPALDWFRSTDIDEVQRSAQNHWQHFVEALPVLDFPHPAFARALRRSALAAALHCDRAYGAIASGFDRGLHAYCWPREVVTVGGALDRVGQPSLGRSALNWLSSVRTKGAPYTYWFHKYAINGVPEWETPALDQTAILPWGIERHYRRTGDLDFVLSLWPVIEQATAVCSGESNHPGMRWIDDLSLVSSAGVWDNRYAAFLYGNACSVTGLRAAARLARLLGRLEVATNWQALADRIWDQGILSKANGTGPGLIDPDSGRFLEARRLSCIRGLWTEDPDHLIENSGALAISSLGLCVPFDLIPAADPRMKRTADAILLHNLVEGNALTRWSPDPQHAREGDPPTHAYRHDPSSLSTLWMTRYLIQLGRETGDPRPWSQAIEMLEGVLSRLGPLGLSLNYPPIPGSDLSPGIPRRRLPGVWGLHAMLIETLLDLVGFDYEAPTRCLFLEPILPPTWPFVGSKHRFLCGEVSFRLECTKPEKGRRLSLEADLEHPIRLQVDVTTPGLAKLNGWKSSPDIAPPKLDTTSGRLQWTVQLPAGPSKNQWSWS